MRVHEVPSSEVAAALATGSPRDRFVVAALELLDAGEPLTLHRLGDAVGLSHTAVYRHFPNLTALVAELASRVLSEALTQLPDAERPRDRLRSIVMALRTALNAHPALAVALATVEATPVDVIWVQDVAAAELRRIGVPSPSVPVVLQALEGLVVGTSAFDLARAPRHLSLRAERLRRTTDPALRTVGQSAARVAANNAAAFELALDAILDAAERLAADA
jgi:AcrR family transcriptional regulator